MCNFSGDSINTKLEEALVVNDPKLPAKLRDRDRKIERVNWICLSSVKG